MLGKGGTREDGTDGGYALSGAAEDNVNVRGRAGRLLLFTRVVVGMRHLHVLALLLFARAVDTAPPPSSTLFHFIAALTDNAGDPAADAASGGVVSACVGSTVAASGRLATDPANFPSSQPPEAFLLRTLLETHPAEAAPLAACLISRGAAPAGALARWGGALLFWRRHLS